MTTHISGSGGVPRGEPEGNCVSEVQLRAITDNVQDAIVLINPEGVVTFWNPAAERMFGYAVEEAIGREIHALIAPTRYRAAITDGMGQFRHTGQGKNISAVNEYPALRKDGTSFWVSLSVSAVRINNAWHAVGIMRDITKKRALETTLVEQQERFDGIAEQGRIVVWEVNLDGMYTYVNAVAEKVFGYSPDELVGKKTFYDLHPEEGRDEFKESALEFFARKASFADLENPIQRKDGRVIWVSTDALPVSNAKGALLGYRGSDRDITERKEMQAKLLASEARWQFAVEGAGDGLWDYDLETNTMYYSKQWKRILGFAEHEFENTLEAWSSRVHPDDVSVFLEDFHRHLDGQTPMFQNEHRLRCKDGTYKWVLDRGKTMEWAAPGLPKRILGTLSDITNAKLVESQLRNYSKSLEEESQYLERIFEASPVGMMLIDESFTVRQVNDVASRLVNRKSAELFGKKPGDGFCCIHALAKGGCEESEACAECPIRGVIMETLREGRRTLGLEVERQLILEGVPRTVHLLVSSVPLPIRNRQHALFAIENITERKLAELALRESEKKFRDMFELSPIGIGLIDFQTGAWLNANQALMNSTGYTADELRALTFADITPPEYADIDREQWEIVHRADVCGPFDKEYIRKDGQRYHVRILASKMTDASGRDMLWTFVDDISAQKQSEQELVRLSVTDSLTQTFNRIKLIEELERELERTERYGTDFALIMFDIDHFKRVNDTYGHGMGDAVLVETALLVREVIRQTDVFARWGGEEFMVLTINTTVEHAAALAERLRAAFAEHEFAHPDRVTCSFGVTGFLKGDQVDTMTQRADEALYAAKEAGRNRVVVR